MTRQSLSRFLSERSELRTFMARLLNLFLRDSPAEEARKLVGGLLCVNSAKMRDFRRILDPMRC